MTAGSRVLDETLDLGVDAGTPVTDDYAGRGNDFTGTIEWVQIGLGLDDHDHLADPSQRAQVALTKQ